MANKSWQEKVNKDNFFTKEIPYSDVTKGDTVIDRYSGMVGKVTDVGNDSGQVTVEFDEGDIKKYSKEGLFKYDKSKGTLGKYTSNGEPYANMTKEKMMVTKKSDADISEKEKDKKKASVDNKIAEYWEDEFAAEKEEYNDNNVVDNQESITFPDGEIAIGISYDSGKAEIWKKGFGTLAIWNPGIDSSITKDMLIQKAFDKYLQLKESGKFITEDQMKPAKPSVEDIKSEVLAFAKNELDKKKKAEYKIIESLSKIK